jgi:hypothetical protein
MFTRPCAILVLTVLLVACLFSTTARADESSARLSNADLESGVYLLVPDFAGELSVAYETEGRLGRRGDSLSLALPPVSGNLVVGYNRYFDPWGRANGGLYLSAGSSLGSGGGYGRIDAYGLGFTLETRFMNANFVYLDLGLIGELGFVSWSRAPETLVGQPVDLDGGTRVTAGVSMGLGLLTWLDPYVWLEVPSWIGVEYMNLGGHELWSLAGGLRIELDFAHRP